MNSNEPQLPWEQLVNRARCDRAPGIDVNAVLRRVREEPLPAMRATWFSAFSLVFANPRGLTACLAGAMGAAAVLAWQLQDLWEAVSWAALLTSGGGA